MRALVFAAALVSTVAADEARVSVDAREAAAVDVITVLARAGDFQPVFDPGISCSLTLKLDNVSWRASLDHVLRACGLGLEEDGKVLRIAPRERLHTESLDRRRLAEARGQARTGTVATFRLSYARAAEIAPLLKRLLPAGDVVFDSRTNTLLILD